MSFRSTMLVAAFTSMLATCAMAQVQVTDAWVRATVPQQQATGAFMQLRATQDSRLVAVRSPLTPNAEVHEMALENDVMKMRQVPAIALPAGKTVDLKPGGYHVMLLNLKQPVKAGDTVPLTLVFERANGQRETVEVQAPVRPLGNPTSGAPGAHKH